MPNTAINYKAGKSAVRRVNFPAIIENEDKGMMGRIPLFLFSFI
jgi:hypothetical protein